MDWSIKEIVQGKPFGHPSHAMFVHFPVAFYFGALAFDVLSRLGRFPEAPVAATWLLVGAAATTLPTVITGLVDWWGMVPGSSKWTTATRHMLFQFAAASFFVTTLALRWTHRHDTRAATLWLVLEAVGVVLLTAGQWLGGVLVYRMGMRVSTKKPVPEKVAKRSSQPNA